MIIPAGEYRYEIRRGAELLGTEYALVGDKTITAHRLSAGAGGENRFEIEAHLNSEDFVQQIKLRYARGPFTRSAVYEVDGELLRGTVNALGGATAAETKLGRFREIDTTLVIFRALLLGHARRIGKSRWTGRVAVIDSSTLMVRLVKQTCYQDDDAGLRWVIEPAIGERERVELDAEGRLLCRTDAQGIETRLVVPAGR